MKVTFKQFLKEGLIQNPPKLLKDIVDFVVFTYLAYVKDKIETHLEGNDFNTANRLLKKTCDEHKMPMPPDKYSEKVGKSKMEEHEFKLDFSDLPRHYLDKLKKLGTDVSKLHSYDHVIAELDLSPQSTIKSSGLFHPDTLTMSFSLKYSGMILDEDNIDLDRIHSVLLDKLPSLVGVVDHECAHMVQFLVLRRFHEYNVKSDYASDNLTDENSDDYYNSQVEFDPQIKSEAAYFKGVEKLSKEFDVKDYDKEKALAHFTYADGTTPPKGSDLEKISYTRRSPFFAALKRKNPTQWKKAIKLLSQLV